MSGYINFGWEMQRNGVARDKLYIPMVLSSENSEKAIFLLFKPLN